MLTVNIIRNGDCENWNRFVSEHPSATFYHMKGWRKVIEKSLHFEPVCLAAEENGEIKAALPLFRMKSILWGKSYSSAPASNFCGPLWTDDAALKAVIDCALKLVTDSNSDYLQIRVKKELPVDTAVADISNVTSVINLSPENNYPKKFKKEVRKRIRQAEDSGLKAGFGRISVQEFYEVYAKSMHRLGSPPFGLDFFEAILMECGENAFIAHVEYEGRIIAADILVCFRDRLMSLFAGSLHEYHNLSPNYLLLSKEIELGIEKGCSLFDLGRSRAGSSVLIFKENFNAATEKLYYYNIGPGMKHIPVRDRKSPFYSFLSSAWRIMPYPFTKVIGPRFVGFLH